MISLTQSKLALFDLTFWKRKHHLPKTEAAFNLNPSVFAVCHWTNGRDRRHDSSKLKVNPCLHIFFRFQLENVDPFSFVVNKTEKVFTGICKAKKIDFFIFFLF